MNTRVAKAAAQRVSADFAASLVKSGMWLDYGGMLCQPDVFDKALAARADELSNVKIRSCITMKPRAVLEEDPSGEHFHWFSLHFSGYDRKKHDAGRCHYMPVNLGEIPGYYRRFIEPVDVVILKTCPMDENGYFNFSGANLWHRAIVERARTVIVEESRGLPYAFGVQNGVHVSEVDYIVSGDDAPAPELPGRQATDVDRAVGRYVAAEVEDGACLQIGIGAMADSVCGSLLESGVKDLGVQTEMLTDGLVALYDNGQITGARKAVHPGKIAYSFALGSQHLYSTIDRNPDLLCLPVDHTNLPSNVMRNERVVSVNNTTSIDLQGQAASEATAHRHISGTGGQLEFARGSYASPGGKGFLCLASTFEKNGQRRSRVVMDLPPGTITTTPRTDVMYVVTEFGIVNLKGKSVPERAKALISIAHPDFRDDLERQAYEHRIIPRGLTFS